jgi:hypothetical protein
MSRKLDLDKYLSRYQNDHDRKTTAQDIKQSRLKQTAPTSTFNLRNSAIKENRVEKHERNPQQFYRSRIAINDNVHVETDFHRSQGECLDLIQNIRHRLADKQIQMAEFTDTYARELEESLQCEHKCIRQQMLEKLDLVFS